MRFPRGFLWGAASAAYQTEGSPAGDGKGPSIWDVFSHKPGATFQGHTGDTACDTCRRWESDMDLMAELGIPNYRFSLSWPRVLPDGTGRVNEAGLAFYARLVDGCLCRGIEPWVTLYYWDLPQTLEGRGGWRVRETAEAFANYAKIVAAHFRGRVRHYFTLNEPQCVSVLGYGTGEHAPGLRLGLARYSNATQISCWPTAWRYPLSGKPTRRPGWDLPPRGISVILIQTTPLTSRPREHSASPLGGTTAPGSCSTTSGSWTQCCWAGSPVPGMRRCCGPRRGSPLLIWR